MSADQQQNDDQLDQDQQQQVNDQTGGDNDQGKPASRQERRDQAARERAAELETERDKLAGRVEALQRAEVERLAAQVLAQAEDLFAVGGVKLEDVLDDEGNVDPDAVAAMAAALVDQRPGLSVNAEIKRGYADWGHSRTKNNDLHAPGGTGAPSWSDAFGAAGRGGVAADRKRGGATG